MTSWSVVLQFDKIKLGQTDNLFLNLKLAEGLQICQRFEKGIGIVKRLSPSELKYLSNEDTQEN